jgi:hypothetical protein
VLLRNDQDPPGLRRRFGKFSCPVGLDATRDAAYGPLLIGDSAARRRVSGVAALSHFSAAAALFSARESARPQLANGKPYMSAVSTGHDAAGTAVERIRAAMEVSGDLNPDRGR